MNRIDFIDIPNYGIIILDAVTFISSIEFMQMEKTYQFRIVCAGVCLPFQGTEEQLTILRTAIYYILRNRNTAAIYPEYGELKVVYDQESAIIYIERQEENHE